MHFKKILLLALLPLMAMGARAGDRFVPRSIEGQDDIWLDLNRQTVQYGTSTSLYQLFEFPDEIQQKLVNELNVPLFRTKVSDLEKLGCTLTVTTEATRDNFFSDAGWSAGNDNVGSTLSFKVFIKAKYNDPGQPGEGRVNFSITYKGETVTKTFHRRVGYYEAVDETFDADNESVTKIDFSYNDRATNSKDKLTSFTVEVVEAPKYGDVGWETIRYQNHLGNYTTSMHLVYTPHKGVPNYSYDVIKIRKTIPKSNDTRNLTEDFVVEKTITLSLHKNPYATKIIDFLPAPGQFVNSSESFNFAGAKKLLGVDDAGNKVTPDKSAMVSLGGFGGYIIFGFDQPITNDPRHPYGVDFTILGNSFEPWEKGWWCEPAAVAVMEDTNGDGIPNDGEWLELAGSDYWARTTRRNIDMTYYNPHYDSRYTVPWTTSDGQAGALITNNYHLQPYWPLPECYPNGTNDDTLTFTGTLIECSPDKRCPSYIEFDRAPAFGYADNRGVYTADLTKPLNPYIDDENGKASDGFDLSWAVNSKGEYQNLEKADFVKVYTNGSFNAGWLGEWSSEVCGIALTTPVEGYEGRDWYINYICLNRVQVVKDETYRFEGFVFRNGRPVDEGTPRWWVDDESVATVDNQGNFTGLSVGKTKLHFQQYADAPEDVVEIEVCELKGLLIDLEGHASTVSNDALTCVTGEKVYINVESITTCTNVRNGTMENRYIWDTYTWENSNPAAGTMDNGLFTALAPGVTTLTVMSDHDKSFTDKIVVRVIDPVAPVKNVERIKVPAKAPKGEVKLSSQLSNSRNATIYLESIGKDDDVPVTHEGNIIRYDYTDLEYQTDMLTLNVTCQGKPYVVEMPVFFGPDQTASPAQLLFAGTELKGVATETADGVKTYVADLGGTAQTVVAEGAYAWVTTDNAITRYCVSTGEVYSTAALTPGNDHGKVAIMGDKIFVADGKDLRRLYKTDLTVAGEPFAFDDPVADFCIYDYEYYNAYYDPRAVYVVTGTKDYTLRQIALKDGAVADETVSLGKVRPQLMNPVESTVDAVFDNTTVVRCNMSGATIPAGIATPATPVNAACLNSKILVADGAGIYMFTYKSGAYTRDAEPLATLPANIVSMVPATVKSGYSSNYFVYATAADSKVYAYKFASNKLTTAECSATVPAGQFTAEAFMAAVAENDAPITTSPAPVVVYEMTEGKYTSITPAVKDYNDASQYSKSWKLYPRNLDEFAWLSSPMVSATSITFTPQCDFRIDEKETRTLRCEVIDDAGASAFLDIPFQMTPWLYKPHIDETPMTICTQKPAEGYDDADMIDREIDFGTIFMLSDNPHLTTMTYDIADEAPSTYSLGEPRYAVDETNPQILHLYVPWGYDGELTMHLKQTSHFIHDNEEVAQYGFDENSIPDKEFLAHIPVTLDSRYTLGLPGTLSPDRNVTVEFDEYSKTLRVSGATRGECLSVFTVSGAVVLSRRIDRGEAVADVSMLPAGVYAARCGASAVKFVINR